MFMRYGTSIISGVILAFTCGVLAYTRDYASGLSGAKAASFEFAYLYLGILAVCSLGALISGLVEAKLLRFTLVVPGRRFYLFLALCLVYLLLLTYAGGYLPATVITLTAGMLLLGIRPLSALTVSTGFSLFMYGVFSGFLNVPLP